MGEGERRRDEGMDRVGRNTPPEYREAFEATYDRLVDSGRDFCGEDVVFRVGRPPWPTHVNAIGAIMNALTRTDIRSGRIELVDWKKVRHPDGHARWTKVYRERRD